MGWAKFDDQFTDHPKIVAAGALAELLAVRAVIHCARYETDGHVRAAVLTRLTAGIPNPRKHVEALVREGLWDEDPDGDGWWVHDFLDFHPSRDELEGKRAEAKERMRRVRSQGVRTNLSRTDTEQNGNKQRSSPNPDPSRPVPVPSNAVETSREIDISSSGVSLEPAARPRNPWYDACVVAFDMPERGTHEGVFGRIAAVCKTQSHPPEEILKRVALHMATFDWAPTPASVLKRWDELGSSTVTATKEQRRQVESELERMRRRMAIVGGVA